VANWLVLRGKGAHAADTAPFAERGLYTPWAVDPLQVCHQYCSNIK
jgi:hypothetical protein